MEQVMTRCTVKTICMKKLNRSSAAKHQKLLLVQVDGAQFID